MNTGEIAQKKRKAKQLLRNNQINEAYCLYQDVCQQSPDHESLYQLGLINGMMSNYAMAEALLQQSIRLKPDFDLSWNNLAIMQISQGKKQEALNSLNRTLQINPGNTHALNTLGNLYKQHGNYAQADVLFKKAYGINAKDPLTLNNLGNMQLDRSLNQEAIQLYKKAIKYNNKYFDAIYNMGSAYQSIGNLEEAIKCYKRAHKINPTASQPISALASVFENQGNCSEALELLEPLLKKNNIPSDVAIQYGKACLNIKSYDDGINIINQCLSQTHISPVDERELRFILGNIYDKKLEYDIAFKQYNSANNIHPYTYNRKHFEDYFNAIKNTFSLETKNKRNKSHLHHVINPVFIVGMPRSGTSLIEQIISSHSLAGGAGELLYIAEIANMIGAEINHKPTFPANINKASVSQLETHAASYMQKISDICKGKSVITDKMPHNFIYIGLIQMLFPDCKIIHCLRDPLDVCLSIYFHNFNVNHPYSDKLSNLGHYYNLYRDLMDHWHNYDKNILDIQYESVIENPTKQIHRLLNHIDLEFQDSCVQFYNNKRTISTPSYAQVRQPLYKTSINRWQHYTRHIDELREAINENFLLN